MPLMDKISHSANVAKWKINQQKQILQIQSNINKINGKIALQKSTLGDLTYKLFSEGNISEETLAPACQKLQELFTELDEEQRELEFVRNDNGPVYEEPFTSEIPEELFGETLVCPNCGKVVPVRFCPDCGVEGVPVAVPDQDQ